MPSKQLRMAVFSLCCKSQECREPVRYVLDMRSRHPISDQISVDIVQTSSRPLRWPTSRHITEVLICTVKASDDDFRLRASFYPLLMNIRIVNTTSGHNCRTLRVHVTLRTVPGHAGCPHCSLCSSSKYQSITGLRQRR